MNPPLIAPFAAEQRDLELRSAPPDTIVISDPLERVKRVAKAIEQLDIADRDISMIHGLRDQTEPPEVQLHSSRRWVFNNLAVGREIYESGNILRVEVCGVHFSIVTRPTA